jgi:predicted kinase
MSWTGSASTRLIVLRGNSASGKSSVAAEIRSRYGRGIAIVGQDNLRRAVLRERDIPGGANIQLIDTVARYALDRGYHTIVEGILCTAHYADMLSALCQDHRGISRLYYLDVPFEETMRRHATKPQAAEYGRAEMSRWYLNHDLIPGDIEDVVPASSSLDDTVERILRETGLHAHDAALLVQQP